MEHLEKGISKELQFFKAYTKNSPRSSPIAFGKEFPLILNYSVHPSFR